MADWLGQGVAVTLSDAVTVPHRLAVLQDDTEAEALPDTDTVGEAAEEEEPDTEADGEPVREKLALPLARTLDDAELVPHKLAVPQEDAEAEAQADTDTVGEGAADEEPDKDTDGEPVKE